MQKYSHQRKRLERLQRRLAVAGNGLFLAGSVLYLSDSGVRPATWLFIVGSACALVAGMLPQMIHTWFSPPEEDPDEGRHRGGPLRVRSGVVRLTGVRPGATRAAWFVAQGPRALA